MSLNCNLDLMCGTDDGLGGPIFYLPFTGGSIDGFYSNYAKASGNFKRASVANQLNDIGATPVAVDVPKLNHGIDLEGASVNKITATKSNPSNTTGLTISGSTGATLSAADDSTSLDTSKLTDYGPNTYKVDNSVGSGVAVITDAGTTGNTNLHSLSLFIRSGEATLRLKNTATGAVSIAASTNYVFKYADGLTPTNTSDGWALYVPIGSVVYFTLPKLEEMPIHTTPNIVDRATEGSNLSDNGLTYTLDTFMLGALLGRKQGA